MNYCTYLYRDPKTNVPRYVGEGVLRRPYDHLRKKAKSRIGYMLNKRKREGYDPKPEIIFASSKADAEEMQDLLIEMIGCEFDGTGPLFNLTKRATGGGRKLTPEQLAARKWGTGIKRPPEWGQAISEGRIYGAYKPTPEHIENNRQAHIGTSWGHHTPEGIENIRAGNLGIKHNVNPALVGNGARAACAIERTCENCGRTIKGPVFFSHIKVCKGA